MEPGNNTSVVRIPCTFPGCRCQEFKPTSEVFRQCSFCPHGWVPHALDKMNIIYDWPAGKFEAVTFDAVFDVASLILYGTHAIPLRLHVCLYRLLCTLDNQEDCIRIAGVFGWPWDDIVRGHKLDDGHNGIRNSWTYATLTDETMILGHFLKFKATQSIATVFLRELTEQKNEDNPYTRKCVQPESTLQTFFLQNQRQLTMSNMLVASNANQNGLANPQNGQKQQILFRGVPGSNPVVHQDGNGNMTPILVRTMPQQSVQIHNSGDTQNHVQSPAFSLNLNPPTVPHAPGKRKIQPKPAGAPTFALNTEVHPVSAPPAVSPVPPVQASKSTPKEKENGKSEHGHGHGHPPRKSPSKRVQCENCQKTFCDKGALKIHYSAVHLKEMHRCSVIGCNMMFSSRRSRNRHSSNTNPRLHQNMFAPRRGGILASPDELPPHGEKSIADSMVMSESDDDDDRSLSYDEVSPKRTDSVEEGESKLVIAAEEFKDDLNLNGEETMPNKKFRADMSPAIPSTMASTAPTMAPAPTFLSSRRSAEPTMESPTMQNIIKKSPRSKSQHGSRFFLEDHSDHNGFSHEEEEAGSLHSEPSGSSVTNSKVTVRFDEQGKPIIPVDPVDPNRCVECGKCFKNHFTFRTHFINVHLRLMHPCTVAGCSSQFPSVRSRDRHSQNINLHLKDQMPSITPAETFFVEENPSFEEEDQKQVSTCL